MLDQTQFVGINLKSQETTISLLVVWFWGPPQPGHRSSQGLICIFTNIYYRKVICGPFSLYNFLSFFRTNNLQMPIASLFYWFIAANVKVLYYTMCMKYLNDHNDLKFTIYLSDWCKPLYIQNGFSCCNQRWCNWTRGRRVWYHFACIVSRVLE